MQKKICILILIGFIVYFNSLFNGFVWDDEEQVLNNTFVHSFSNFFTFFSSSTFNSGGTGSMGGLYYKPLMTVFFSFLYSIFGANAFWFHLFQVIIHLANSVLVFVIFSRLFVNIKKESVNFIPFILALIFVIHPINSEAVVYISDLQDILFFFFGIFSLWLVMKWNQLNFKKVLLISFLLLCSILSKETGFIFIITIFLYILIYKKKYIFNYSLSTILSAAVYSYLRFGVAHIYFNKHGLSPITTMSFWERIISIPQIILSYLNNFIFPQYLTINQHWVVKSINLESFILPLVIEIILFSLVIFYGVVLYKKNINLFKIYLFFFCLFILSLGLHLHIFPLDLTVSDRWFYMPITGLLGIIGVLLTKINISNKFLKIILSGLIILVCLSLSIRTIVRNSNWKNGLTLYSHDIKYSKDSFDLENNYGVELFRANRIDEAEIHFLNSTKLAPFWWTNWNNLGVIAERKGDYQKSKEYYQKAIDNGQYYLAYENLAKILLYHNDPKLAKEFTENSLQYLPQNPNLWFILALSEYKLGDTSKALIASKQAYYLSPNSQTYYVYSQLSKNLPIDFK